MELGSKFLQIVDDPVWLQAGRRPGQGLRVARQQLGQGQLGGIALLVGILRKRMNMPIDEDGA